MHQKIVTNVEQKIRTIGLILKPQKCRAISIKSGKTEIFSFHRTYEKGNKVNIGSVLVNQLTFLGAILAEINTLSARLELIKGVPAKTMPPETLKCPKTKTCRAKNLKL